MAHRQMSSPVTGGPYFYAPQSRAPSNTLPPPSSYPNPINVPDDVIIGAGGGGSLPPRQVVRAHHTRTHSTLIKRWFII